MTEFYAFWQALDPAVQVTVAGTIAGMLLYLLQKYWQNCPILGVLGKTDSTRKKRLTAILMALGTGAGIGRAADASVETMLAIAFITFCAGQTTFLMAEKTEQEEVQKETPKV